MPSSRPQYCRFSRFNKGVIPKTSIKMSWSSFSSLYSFSVKVLRYCERITFSCVSNCSGVMNLICFIACCANAGKDDYSKSNRQQHTFYFLEPRLGFFFDEAREFAAERDEIVVARDF